MKIVLLRVAHGIFSLYFLLCLIYLYYVGITAHFDYLLAVAVISLGLEGFTIFVLNNGDCPLIHIQRRIGDDKPFFELFLPPNVAKRAIPVFARITWVGVGILTIRVVLGLG